MSSGGRIDIVIFPNGGREIFARTASNEEVPTKKLIDEVNDFVTSYTPPSTPKKFTCIWSYNGTELVVAWSEYDDSNPIVNVDKTDLGIPYDSEQDDSDNPDTPNIYNMNIVETISVELASLPSEVAEKYNPNKEF